MVKMEWVFCKKNGSWLLLQQLWVKGSLWGPSCKTGDLDGDLRSQRIMNVAPCLTQTADEGSVTLPPARLKSEWLCTFSAFFFTMYVKNDLSLVEFSGEILNLVNPSVELWGAYTACEGGGGSGNQFGVQSFRTSACLIVKGCGWALSTDHVCNRPSMVVWLESLSLWNDWRNDEYECRCGAVTGGLTFRMDVHACWRVYTPTCVHSVHGAGP